MTALSILILLASLLLVALISKATCFRFREPPPNLTDADILRVALEGQKIDAIKWYRTLHGVGLKEAKEEVEKLVAQAAPKA